MTAHFGNWEVMGARAVQEFPLAVVVGPTSNSSFEGYIEALRCKVGIKMISKFETAQASLQVLRANEALGIFPDQHTGRHGVMVPLFGHPTRFVSSLARLALVSRAPVVPSFGVRRTPWLADGRIIATMSPGFYVRLQCGERWASGTGRENRHPAAREAAVVEGTRRVICEIENIVRRHPDQWLWMHRRWRPEDTVQARTGIEDDGIHAQDGVEQSLRGRL